MRDRVGLEHPLKAGAGCRNTLFNGRAQTGAEYAAHLLQLGARHFRVAYGRGCEALRGVASSGDLCGPGFVRFAVRVLADGT